MNTEIGTYTGTDSTELVSSIDIEQMVLRRNHAVTKVEEAYDALATAEQTVHAIPLPTTLGRGTHYFPKIAVSKDKRGDMREQIDSLAWRSLMDKSGLFTFMDKKARDDWYVQTRTSKDKSSREEKDKVPVFAFDLIATTFQSIHSNRGHYFRDGLVRLYRSLSWHFKTNNPRMLGKRIIQEWAFDTWLNSTNFPTSLRYENRDKLDDLERVFRVLDGKEELPHTQSLAAAYGHYVVKNTNKEVWVDAGGYFKLKGFKKGTLHIEFLRPDLVDEANRIIADAYPNALPAS